MALHSVSLSLLALFCCGVQLSIAQTDRPPFVALDSMFNELEDLRFFVGESFTTDAVQYMTATLEAGSTESFCPSYGPIAVQGNMDCLLAYWRFSNTSPKPLLYQTWIDADREECDYTIGYSHCLSRYDAVDQKVCMDPSVAVDGNSSTTFAHPITEGQGLQMKINLHGSYKVAALSMDVESVPLNFTISLSSGNGPIRDVVKYQQDSCEGSSSPVCLQHFSMDRKLLTVSWDFSTEDEIVADHLTITFHGVTSSGPYVTNYHVIREILFLAKLNEAATTTTTTTTLATTTAIVASRVGNRSKSLRQILVENGWKYEIPYSHL